jgi:hypothetical protein
MLRDIRIAPPQKLTQHAICDIDDDNRLADEGKESSAHEEVVPPKTSSSQVESKDRPDDGDRAVGECDDW